MARVRQLKRSALRTVVNQSFMIACSHYGDNIDLEMMSLGFVPSYTDTELDEIEAVVAPLLRDLADKMEDTILPRRV